MSNDIANPKFVHLRCDRTEALDSELNSFTAFWGPSDPKWGLTHSKR